MGFYRLLLARRASEAYLAIPETLQSLMHQTRLRILAAGNPRLRVGLTS